MKLSQFILLLSFSLTSVSLPSFGQQGSTDNSMDDMQMPPHQSASHQQIGGMTEMMEQMHQKLHRGGQTSCHVRHQRGAKLRAGANADVNEGRLDVDVPLGTRSWSTRSSRAPAEATNSSQPTGSCRWVNVRSAR